MSEAEDRFLQNTDDGAFIYVSNPELYKRICGYMGSYAREYHAKEMERKLEEELDKVKLMTEYHVIQNPTKYDYRDVENARKVINTTKWLLNHLKKEYNAKKQD